MKNQKPTAADFLPGNRKTIKEMRAYTSKLPTTPGFQLERSELKTMCEQIQFMTANSHRIERQVQTSIMSKNIEQKKRTNQ